jgi:cysteinyl-tRNA synthetase
MFDIYLSNTLTKRKQKFTPIKKGEIGIYSCGPTVYWNQHIGHMYAYSQWDVLVRFLRFVGYKVKWVMNITDVGHMTSDSDSGEDKMEKGAKREGLSVWQLAQKYIGQFEDSMGLLNIKPPDVLCRATEHIGDQINLIEKIEKNGFTYKTKKGLVFNTAKFPDYAKFAGLNLSKQQIGARAEVEVDPEKKVPWDFFLWVIDPKHIMKWPSPWGVGYPGWHIECTAMSTKYLGDNFDIHTGGIDHLAVHHTNEIAQGYGAFGKTTANFWLHNAHLTAKGGEKMSKSLGNFVTAQELVQKGYDPLAFRYLVLNSHYKKGINFSWEALDSAQIALNRLRENIISLRQDKKRTVLSPEKLAKMDDFKNKFIGSLADDINIPQALAVFWEVLKSNIPSEDKYDLAISFDEVLGLKLSEISNFQVPISNKITKLVKIREELRKAGKWQEADKVRVEIEKEGYKVNDTAKGSLLRKQ